MTADVVERLQFSSAFQVVPESDHRVILYAGDGAGLELAATDCNLRRLCELLTQGASRSEIDAEVGDLPDRIAPILHTLQQNGLVTTIPCAPDWPSPLLERMDRQVAFFRRYEAPGTSRYDYIERLRRAHVLLLGVGSLGSWCLQHLVATGVGRITAVDSDHVSESNLARQSFYRSADVGSQKVTAAARVVAELSSWTEFRGIDRRLHTRSCVASVLRAAGPVDLLILTADEPLWEISVFTAEAARDAGTAMLRGNSQGLGPLTRFGETACPACDWPRVARTFSDAQRLVTYYRASAAGRAPKAAISTHISVAGGVLAQEAIAFLSGAGAVRTENARLLVRESLAVDRVPFERHTECKVCATPAADAVNRC